MGEAVTDAASWYAQANWIGIHATPRATIILNGILEKNSKTRDYVTVDYCVPMKDGSALELKVVNWPKALFVEGLATEAMKRAPRASMLAWFGRHPIPRGAEDKCFRTIEFFDDIVKRQKLKPTANITPARKPHSGG